MPGGKWHEPLWTPYELYGKIDYVYGWKALEEGSGFTSAQAALNMVESVLNFIYLYAWYNGKGTTGRTPVMLGLVSVVMTVSKTVLYWLNEGFSGFQGIGHNDPSTLFWLWIVPNGAWLVVPTYCGYVFWNEIAAGLDAAPARPVTKKVQ